MSFVITNKRIVELDILKFIGIVLVVIGHTQCPPLLCALIYFIHMPLFFYISGITNREDDYYISIKNIIGFVKKRVHSLYLPFLKFVLPICLLHNVFYSVGLYDIQYSTNQYIFQLVRVFFFSVGETEPFLPQLWFIKVLFITELLYAGILWISSHFKISKWWPIMIISFPLFIIPVGVFPHVMATNIIWPARALVFYSLGLYHQRLMMSLFNSIPNLLFGFVVLLLSSFYYGKMGIQSVYGISSLVLLYLITFTVPLFYRIASFIATRYQRFGTDMAYGGRISKYIYFWQYIIFKLLSLLYVLLYDQSLFSQLSLSHFIDDIGWFVYALAGVVIPITLSLFVDLFHENRN